MAISETGTRTSNTLGGEYQVFLNFRGPDTRRGFANILYHALLEAGIHVFIDDESVRWGERIDGELLRAIDDCRLYISIFSKNYASSHWCLDELVKIMKNTSESKDGNTRVILPIFYDVTPDVVKLKTGRYKEHISALKEKRKLSTEEVEKWRRALFDVDAIKGYERKSFKGDGHLSTTIVEEVVKRLWIKRRIVTNDLVGMRDQIAAINKLLGTDSGAEYQVFISFRGRDTREFVSIFNQALTKAGIHVFLDNEVLRHGKDIRDDYIFRAINESNLCIPILSQNYTSSLSCLKELVSIVKSKDGDQVILPIFYDVEPNDVKLKMEVYGDAIPKCDVKAWQQALRDVGNFDWLALKNCSLEAGIKSAVKRVVDRLQKERSKAVQLIGIYGMTGIGKSTLAKIIFNQLYPHFGKYCSFLDEVSKMEKTTGLVQLQKQLLSDMSNSRVAQNIKNIDHGINMIGETICNKKVLIVLDDVNDVNQIQELIGMNSLYPGTKILVTTRDKSVLKIKGFKYEIVPYEMKGLSDKNALQLFSRHAFDKNSPPANYDNLSKDIVATVGGLPLALEAIGSLLFLQKEKKIWEEKLEKLQKTPNKDVFGKLRISYDELEQDQQQIFLDIACFFIGENKTNAIYMWIDCRFSPENAIDVLISRCMIKVTDDNKFWMHNQFRDLGRAIATQESSRLWVRDDIICELKSTEIKRSVQALCLQSDSLVTVTSKQIERFPQLRYLQFSHVTCQGDFTGFLSKLKWISVDYPGICHFLQDVVVVNLFGHGFTNDEISSLNTGARKLKVLTLQRGDSHSTKKRKRKKGDLQTLQRLPSNLTVLEFSRARLKQVPLDGLAQLEKLIVEGCELLETLSIPSSLSKLREVKVSSCAQLVKVQFLGVLRLMEKLCIENCKSFKRLENLKHLENLKNLGIKGCESLQVQESNLQTLEQLPSNLTVLELSRTRVKLKPLDGLAQLEKLTVEGCELLKRLCIESRLRKLREVKVSSCKELVEVQILDVLRSMEILCIEDCKSFKRLKNLKNLENLKNLGIKNCKSLQVLTFQESDSQTQEPLPSNLTVLKLSRIRVEQVSLHGLTQLEKLTVKGCELLKGLCIESRLRKLREVKVASCKELVEVQIPDVLRSMEILCIKGCKSFKRLENFKNLENLKDLGIKRCESLQVLTFQESDSQTQERLPSNLTVLELSCTRMKQGPFDGLAQLEKLTVKRCELLVGLSISTSLSKLREVKVSSCTKLVKVQFLDVLRSMEILCIEDCNSFKQLDNLIYLKNLKDLSIKRCESLQVVGDISELELLQWLTVKECRSMERINASSSVIPNKCEISMMDCGKLPDTSRDGSSITFESYREMIQN